jgi:hypothetical protein
VAGNTGVAGNIGAAGNTGAAGTSGVAGTTGTAGTTGAAGSTGVAGAGGTPGCGPKTCPTGCCDATGKCVAGRALSRCGNGGAACSTCGKCQLCNSSGVCDVDPSSTWDVICGEAVVAAKQPSGLTWDPQTGGPDGPAPDPFCEFEMPAGSLPDGKVTVTLGDTYTPVWNYDVTPHAQPIKASDLMSSSKTWRLWVGDDDGCNAHGCVAQEICAITQPLTAGALLAGQLVHTNLASCISLTVNFVCQQ